MRKSFGARRVPRKVGQDEDEDAGATSSGTDAGPQTPEPVVKRAPSKAKKRSSLRLSFGPGESATEGDDDSGAVFTPKKSNLSRIAAEKNAERKGFRVSLTSDQLPAQREVADERPSYSKEALAELRDSQPSTPKPGPGDDGDEPEGKEVDIAAKFGPLASLKSSSAIPTDAEIREKKERRRRLAQEPGFMSLDGDEDRDRTVYDDDNAYDSDDLDRPRDVTIRTTIKEKYPEGRLVREDEDVAEGFEDFVEDGRISLGRKAEREAARKRREEMASMIADAEGGGSGDDESDDSEDERNAAYVAAQTKAGTYGSRDKNADDPQRPRTPPKISSLPELGGVLARLRASLKEQEEVKAARVRRMEELAREKADIASQESWIQSQLKIAGEKYEKLRLDAGGAGGAATPVNGADSGAASERGLDSLGGTPAPVGSDEDVA
ncbi:uncharacterized protein BKCO1_35000112 [Diplodia corticola]|uniref:Nineteen complex-related protein 2-domain-containing protein n=1 Tax=Diplodia corticola TaxID=236234 RepID=A0A1J9RJT6_9PEZI|nr:uncharacterized protein BKCO1_35000112 [Diplodia corticola]OJD32835.1 hypothetical protein BKCO1_35000112 [Diplodia corticola]